ncbi:MAG: class I SAM-dependent methyltransferase, partial [Proteobacteria bacterium]
MTAKPPGSYFHCQNCDLVFSDPEERLSYAEEKVRYDMHVNQDTEGYRRFLQPVLSDIEEHCVNAKIRAEDLLLLDFGCGPTAFFSKLAAEKNYVTENYDIFYYTNQAPLQK